MKKKRTDKELGRVGVELAVLKVKCGRLGLYRTLHAIDEATKAYVADFSATMDAERKKGGDRG